MMMDKKINIFAWADFPTVFDQIPNLHMSIWSVLQSINEENMTEQIIRMGFKKYDETTYYESWNG